MNKEQKAVERQKNVKRKRKAVLMVVCVVTIFVSAFIFGQRIININHKSTNNDLMTKNNDLVTKNNGQAAHSEINHLRASDDRTNYVLSNKEAQPKLERLSTEEGYESAEAKNIAYLTFDDGPSKNVTPMILDTLKKYNIKATFFVIGSMAEQSPELIKREHEEGHTIGNHTYSHNNSIVYSTPEVCVSDFNKNEAVLKGILGDYSYKGVRFPGGAFDNDTKRLPFRQAVMNAGYHYYNWNCSDQDSDGAVPSGGYSPSVLLNWVKSTSTYKGKPVPKLTVLMHDAPAKTTTAEALPSIIEYLKSEGYVFKTLK